MKRLRFFTECQQMRHVLVTRGTLDASTGKSTETGKTWETRKCGTPLFAGAERAAGTCRACAQGWARPLNFPCP